MGLVTEHDEVPDRVVPMRVVVGGFHRCGTYSMRVALWQLGFYDCYHMHNVISDPGTQGPQWNKALDAKYKGEGTFGKEDWDKLLGRSQACVDLPAALFTEEIAATYPDAKVVILYRDPEKWYKSVLDTVYKVMAPPSGFKLLGLIYNGLLDAPSAAMGQVMPAVGNALPYDHGTEKDKAIAWFEEQYDSMRKNIPKERWIEMRIQDGWKPLCEHLGVPIPMIKDEATGEMVEAPFPRANDTASFHKLLEGGSKAARQRANANLFKLIGQATVLAGVGFAGYMGWKTRLGGRF